MPRILAYGERFHRLKVVAKIVRRYEKRYAVRCDCGKITTATATELINNEIKSCGCLRREVAKWATKLAAERSRAMRLVDLTGHTYGQLTVIKRVAGTKREWWCECICGNMTKAWAHNLRADKTRNCHECIVRLAPNEKLERNLVVYGVHKTCKLSISETAKFFGLSTNRVKFIIARIRKRERIAKTAMAQKVNQIYFAEAAE